MAGDGDRRVGMLFGLLAAICLVLAGLIDIVSGVVFLALGRGFSAIAVLDQSVLFVVLGLVIGFLAVLGRRRDRDRAMVVGVLLFVLALLGFVFLGFGSSVLGILAAIFALIGGVFYLVGSR
ncbi:MAG TPA: hypothetical protein VMG99_00390 [Thermoplasmata archaeon]|nr:hypothetical protein [Thermoplasmata archaeon]